MDGIRKDQIFKKLKKSGIKNFISYTLKRSQANTQKLDTNINAIKQLLSFTKRNKHQKL